MAPIHEFQFKFAQYEVPTARSTHVHIHILERRHETPKDEGPIPLGWIAVAVVVPIIIIALGLWAFARYRRGWGVGEISRKRHRRFRRSNRSIKHSSRRLSSDRRSYPRRWGLEQGFHRHRDQRTWSEVTAWPGADYGFPTPPSTSSSNSWEHEDNRNNDSYVFDWRQVFPTEIEEEMHHKYRWRCRRCHRRSAWDYGQEKTFQAICMRCYKQENRNACVIEAPRKGTYYWAGRGQVRDFGDAKSSYGSRDDYEFGRPAANVAGAGDGRREQNKDSTHIPLPRQMRPARLPVRNKGSYGSLSSYGYDGDYDSGSSSSSWTSRMSGGSPIAVADWRARP
ncbi:hypothetical protein V8F20_004041 [Naviculisporaceae sp. PSN 640]